jgi:hypothetical protein
VKVLTLGAPVTVYEPMAAPFPIRTVSPENKFADDVDSYAPCVVSIVIIEEPTVFPAPNRATNESLDVERVSETLVKLSEFVWLIFPSFKKSAPATPSNARRELYFNS